MGRKPRVDRTPEEKWQIVQEGTTRQIRGIDYALWKTLRSPAQRRGKTLRLLADNRSASLHVPSLLHSQGRANQRVPYGVFRIYARLRGLAQRTGSSLESQFAHRKSTRNTAR